MQTSKHIDWQHIARYIAWDEHENNFASRYGLGELDEGMFYFHDNNPIPERGMIVAAFRSWLNEQPDMSELAFASSHDGYTTCMVIRAPSPGSDEKIRAALYDCIRRRDPVPSSPLA